MNIPSPEFEQHFVEQLNRHGELAVPYLDAPSAMEAGDKTRVYVLGLIKKYGLAKIGGNDVISGGRFTEEYGHHYWVRTADKN